MEYISTRDKNEKKYLSSEVIKQGLASDGGLFIPTNIPALTLSEIEDMKKYSYAERAAYVLSKFLTDYTYEELLSDALDAYCEESFVGGAAPLKKVNESIYSLELWHGPTAAFKDMALQIMPRLLKRALVKTGEERTALILVATSGDTGKAALEGYKNIDKIKMEVFYPENGVSKVQKLQMATQSGDNLSVCAINGNFDDAQTGVKKIFSDKGCAEKLNEQGYFLSSANSINWGRLAPQIVYYISAYCDMVSCGNIKLGDKINVCVPTGNFGNIFAAYIAKLMGLPINKLICASNSNNILTDFLNCGEYDRNRRFYCTVSPSMDILISSNLERLLYLTSGADETVRCMSSLNESGKYKVSDSTFSKIKENFYGYFCDEEHTLATVKKYYNEFNYLSDTHTAVALNCAEQYIAQSNDNTPMVVASTASPFKFAQDVYYALTGNKEEDGLSALRELSAYTNEPITYPLRDLDKKEVRFKNVIEPSDMLSEVYRYIGK